MEKRARRRGREIALQVLYQADTQGQLTAEEALLLHASHFGRPTADEPVAPSSLPGSHDAEADPLSPEEQLAASELATRIVRGVLGAREEIDALVQKASRNWRLERMARVDRNLLRIGAWELSRSQDVPAKVAINEAIEIAKRFGTAESAAFVNGILDRCLEELGRKGEARTNDTPGTARGK